MKKNFLKALFVFSLFSSVSVNATSTGYKDMISQYPGQFVSTTPTSLTSSANVATGANTYVYFSNLATLDNSNVINSTRLLHINLKEDDLTGGDDDVKYYLGTFSGLKLSSITLKTTNLSGDIEGTNDKTAELYLTSSMTKFSGDSSIKQIMHRINVGIN